jgi:hypothetical protein
MKVLFTQPKTKLKYLYTQIQSDCPPSKEGNKNKKKENKRLSIEGTSDSFLFLFYFILASYWTSSLTICVQSTGDPKTHPKQHAKCETV